MSEEHAGAWTRTSRVIKARPEDEFDVRFACPLKTAGSRRYP